MTPEMEKRIAVAMENVAMVNLAIKATGGHKYKEKLGLSDLEAEALMAKGEAKVLRTVVALLVAEDFIDKQTGRLHIYQEYVKSAMLWIGENKAKIASILGVAPTVVEELSRG